MITVLKAVYKDNCLIEVISRIGIKKRQKRDADDAPKPKVRSDYYLIIFALKKANFALVFQEKNVLNLYGFDYSGNFPVAFNIILWTSILIALAVLFVAVGMWFMDPGKDSIIYRMTMTRGKKD